MSPKHLGLAVRLHHEFGSRKLIEELHLLGYCISYPEIRRFTTSAALHVSSAMGHTEGGALLPCDILSKEDGGCQPVAAADNWDHNERTVDGKKSTHAMTSIFIAPQLEDKIMVDRMTRATSYTLDEHMIEGDVLFFIIY